MKDNYQSIHAVLTVLICLVIGSGTQILLWWHISDTWYDALVHWPLLWFFYMLVSMLIAERMMRHIVSILQKREIRVALRKHHVSSDSDNH